MKLVRSSRDGTSLTLTLSPRPGERGILGGPV